MNIKIDLFFLLRKLGGHRLPMSIKKPIGDLLLLKGSFFDQRETMISDLLKLTKEVQGNVVECGVYHADTTIAMAKTLNELKSDKIIYGIDYFDALPYDDNDFPFKQKGLIKKKLTPNKSKYQISIKTVQDKIDACNLTNIKLIKGLVEDVLPKMKEQNFSFVNVDVNSYHATKFCLEFFKSKMSNDGIIFLDDYNQVGWQGATQAADEILGKNNIKTLKHVQAYWQNTVT